MNEQTIVKPENLIADPQAEQTVKDLNLYKQYAAKCCEQGKDFESFSEFRNPTL
jgi:hypothetical protein